MATSCRGPTLEGNEAEVSLKQNYNGISVTAARKIVGSGSMRCIAVYLRTLHTYRVLKTCFEVLTGPARM
jgi:hypothetical protein